MTATVGKTVLETCKGAVAGYKFMEQPVISNNEAWIEYIGDSGAGRFIWSDLAFQNKTLMLSSPGLGKQEAYKLGDSPAAGSMGCTVELADQSIFWTKGVKPFFLY